MPSPIRIALVDDEKHIRLMLRTALKVGGFEVLGEGADGREAIELYRRLRPDVLLLDINLPGMTGEEALAAIMEEFPDALVIMLTSLVEQASVLQALELGAAHYIRKDTPLDEIQRLIKETVQKAVPHA